MFPFKESRPMNACWQASFLVVWLSVSAHAQTPGRQILRASSELVRVDAVVMDRDGRVVSDLTAADFEVRQDGRLQSVTAFTFVRPQTGIPSGAGATAAAPLVAGAQQTTEVPPQIYRTLAIVVDDLGLSFPSVDRVRKALHRFVDQERQPGDLVAIVRAGQSGGTLQQYTRSAERLHEVIDRISWSLFNNSLFAGGTLEEDRSRNAPAASRFSATTISSAACAAHSTIRMDITCLATHQPPSRRSRSAAFTDWW
jgi:VWFA-related protein